MLKAEERKGCVEAYAMYQSLTEAEKEKVPKELIEYIKKHGEINDRTNEFDISADPISSYGWTLISQIASFIT